MKVMKLFSTRARQEVKYFCKNSHAWFNSKGGMARKTVKFLTDNEYELHGHSVDMPLKPEVVSDGCQVRIVVISINTICHLLSLKWY